MVRNQSHKRQKIYEAQPHLGKITQSLYVIKKSRASANITQTARSNELKIAVKVE